MFALWLATKTDQCPCGSAFTVEHSLSCPKGGFPTIHHNEIRDLFAELIRDVCPNVETEPTLQPLNGKAFKYCSTTTDNEARLDIAANGFWEVDLNGHFMMFVYLTHMPLHT